MGLYRSDDGGGWMHVNFGRKGGLSCCVARALPGDNLALGPRCCRMATALCDFPVGQDLGGKPLTCSAPMCDRHRTKVAPNVDHCPRHAAKAEP